MATVVLKCEGDISRDLLPFTRRQKHMNEGMFVSYYFTFSRKKKNHVGNINASSRNMWTDSRNGLAVCGRFSLRTSFIYIHAIRIIHMNFVDLYQLVLYIRKK